MSWSQGPQGFSRGPTLECGYQPPNTAKKGPWTYQATILNKYPELKGTSHILWMVQESQPIKSRTKSNHLTTLLYTICTRVGGAEEAPEQLRVISAQRGSCRYFHLWQNKKERSSGVCGTQHLVPRSTAMTVPLMELRMKLVSSLKLCTT